MGQDSADQAPQDEGAGRLEVEKLRQLHKARTGAGAGSVCPL